ncbi:MAG: ribonuclease J [Lachnospiraceae bacterium]|nr:ribonuclease J [Lachnospiraceae bacterium]
MKDNKEIKKKDSDIREKKSKKRNMQKKASAGKPSGRKRTQDTSVQVIPLGGLNKIGMNITAIRCGDDIIVVDCGLAFPEENMPGIDKIIPDVTYLTDNISKVRAYFITHGHEDHIGALPYVLQQVNVPVYGTKLTIGLIMHKLEEAGIASVCDCRTVRQGSSVKEGCFTVDFIKINHSIPGSSALAIHTPAGVLFHTGDFKVDYTPLFGDTIDLQRIAAIGREGVLALLSDSTNAMRPGFTPSETMVATTFDTIFAENSKSRILVGTFSSNVDRVQQLINTAKKYNRKVVLQGRSMETTIEIAEKLGCIKMPRGTMISAEEMGNYPDNRLVIITTGSQGEAMAALSRMAEGVHKRVSIKPGDVIIFSSNPIPGNERAVARVMNELAEKGAKLIYQDTHVSGHACQQEIELIYTLLHPRYAVPMHGEFRHRSANADLAQSVGVPRENIFLLKAGDVLELSDEKAQLAGHVRCGEIFVDGLGVGDVGSEVLRDRQALAAGGMIIVALTVEPGSGMVLSGPEIVTRGFVYVKDSRDVISEIRDVVLDSLTDCENRRIRDYGKIRNTVRTDLEEYLWRRFQRSPMVLPVIMEAEW